MERSSHSKVIIEISTFADIPFEFVGKVASSSAGSETLRKIKLVCVCVVSMFIFSCIVLREAPRYILHAGEHKRAQR